MTLKQRTKSNLKQGLVCLLWVFGVIVNIATSPPEPNPNPRGGEGFGEIERQVWGSLFLSWPLEDESDVNIDSSEGERATLEPRQVLVSSLDPEIRLDCDEVMKSPLDYLKPEMFVSPREYSVSQGTVVPVNTSELGSQECIFLTLTSSGLPTSLVSMNRDVINNSIETDFDEVTWSTLPRPTIALATEAFVIRDSAMWVRPWSEQLEGEWDSCEQPSRRLSWTIPALFPSFAKLIGLQEGLDGCHSLLFEDEDSITLCAPWEALDVLKTHQWDVSVSNSSKYLGLDLVSSEETIRMEMIRGQTQPPFLDTYSQTPGCEARADLCGTSAPVSVYSPELELSQVPPFVDIIEEDDRTVTTWTVAAEKRSLLLNKEECAESNLGVTVDKIEILTYTGGQ